MLSLYDLDLYALFLIKISQIHSIPPTNKNHSAQWLIEGHDNTDNVAIRMEQHDSMMGAPPDRNYIRPDYLQKVDGHQGFAFGRRSQYSIPNLFDPNTDKSFEGHGDDGFILTLKHMVRARRTQRVSERLDYVFGR